MNNNLECGIWDKEGVCLIPISSLEELPLYHRETIPSDYLDVMGHMNIRWYMTLYDKAAWNFFSSNGLNEGYFREKQAGAFALKHFIQYFAEVRVDQTVAIRTRLIGRSDRRFHFMHFMINESAGQLASILEVLGTHADLKIRRAAPMPSELADKFDAILAKDQQLDWQAPVSGIIRAE